MIETVMKEIAATALADAGLDSVKLFAVAAAEAELLPFCVYRKRKENELTAIDGGTGAFEFEMAFYIFCSDYEQHKAIEKALLGMPDFRENAIGGQIADIGFYSFVEAEEEIEPNLQAEGSCVVMNGVYLCG